MFSSGGSNRDKSVYKLSQVVHRTFVFVGVEFMAACFFKERGGRGREGRRGEERGTAIGFYLWMPF